MKQDTKELMHLVFWDNHKYAGGFKEVRKRGKVVGYSQLFNTTLDCLYIQPELFEYQSIKAMTEKD